MQNQGLEPSPDLLKRYLAGKCSPEEEQEITRWYHSLGQDREKPRLAAGEETALKQKLWSAIRRNTAGVPAAGETSRPRRRYRRLLIWSGAAAACILLILLVRQPGTENSRNLAESDKGLAYNKENTTGKTLCIILPDTSLVWLQPGAGVSYTDFRQEAQRRVSLSGEAYFEVSSDREKPFIVHSGDVVTRVLGTKFNIKPREQERTVEVTVTEGMVEVTHAKAQQQARRNRPGKKKEKPMLLRANERVLYDREKSHLVRQLHPSPLPASVTSPEQARFEFDDAPLIKVIELLETVYRLDIELENEALNHCTLTASLEDETLDTKLELICKSLGATYRRQQHKIFISGDGCAI